nr:MAG TPA: hypothetical protein [Caudoviricetes sp.]
MLCLMAYSIRLCILSLYRVICATLLRGAITTF